MGKRECIGKWLFQYTFKERGTKLQLLGNANAAASSSPLCCLRDVVCKVFHEALASAWAGRQGYISLTFHSHGLSGSTAHMSTEAGVSGLFSRCTGQSRHGGAGFGTAANLSVQHHLPPLSFIAHFSTPFCRLKPCSKPLTEFSPISPPFPLFFLILLLKLAQNLAAFLRSLGIQWPVIS